MYKILIRVYFYVLRYFFKTYFYINHNKLGKQKQTMIYSEPPAYNNDPFRGWDRSIKKIYVGDIKKINTDQFSFLFLKDVVKLK